MRTVFPQLLVILFLAPVPQTLQLAGQDAPTSPGIADTAAVHAWIRNNAIPLTTVEAGNGFADLQPLRKIVGDARVVALGEGTHGTREFFQLKHRLLEFLVSEMDFNIFAIEASLPEALEVNRYVLSGEGDPARLLAGMHFWTWDTEEVLALIRWMREYNLTETRGRKVKFYGFDMQYAARAARTVQNYLQQVDPVTGRRAAWVMGPLADPFVSGEIRQRWSEEKQRELADSLIRVAADFDERLDSYAAMSSTEEADLARRHLEILLQFMGIEKVSRDDAMAANTAWILDREGPDSRAVLWAHNQHVAVHEGSQGEALRAMLGNDLRVFGFSFDRGGFQARDAIIDGAVRPWFVGSPPDTTLGAHLRAASPDVALLDLRSLPEAGPVRSWFMTPQTMRTIGSGYTDQHPDWFWWRAPVAKVYDALVFVEKTTPARANLTGRFPGEGPPNNPANLGFEAGLPGTWPLGWTMPRGAAQVEWDVRLTRADAREGEQAVVVRRAPGPSYGETFASLSQRIDASPWLGQRVTLRAWIRIDGTAENRGHLWFEVTEPGDPYPESVFYESTETRHNTGSEWREYRIVADVSEAADVIFFGFAFAGEGEAWLDGVILERQDETGRPSGALGISGISRADRGCPQVGMPGLGGISRHRADTCQELPASPPA
jgi:erythromycin esterase